ncbi:MAG: hypothetical protein HW374_1450 [Bacteroidetes bacterium]|nr:hypothetical protein [Bacteroidota bacterium]
MYAELIEVGRVADPTKGNAASGRDGVPSYIVTDILISLTIRAIQ